MTKLELNATARTDVGKGASRRLRRENKVPAIIYGAGKSPQNLCLLHNEVIKALENEAFYSQIIDLKVDGKTEKVVLKDLQQHQYKPKVNHIDFQRISANEKLTMTIPLNFIGAEAAPGAKEGGVIMHAINEVEIRCLPANLPQHIDVDISNLQLNETIHLPEIKLPKGVEILALAHDSENDQPVVSIHIPHAEPEPIETAPEEEQTAEATPKEGAEQASETPQE